MPSRDAAGGLIGRSLLVRRLFTLALLFFTLKASLFSDGGYMPRKQVDKESVLVLGGARSGKSGYALQRAQAWSGRLVYLATAEGKDAEMKGRIATHRAQRRSRRWMTVEEPMDVVWQLKELDDSIGAVVLDCLTLWVSNALLAQRRDELENQIAE